MPDRIISFEKLVQVALKLWDYCEKNDFSGYDPYDALNSRLLSLIPGGRTRLFRLIFTQTLKRIPLNLRPLLLIPKTQNPKALALFLRAALMMDKAGFSGPSTWIKYLIRKITELRSPDKVFFCWGYSFPWQTRTLLVPKGAPNLVCTVFVAEALLDAYEALKNQNYLEMALSAGEYILNELFWSDNGETGFSYPMPGQRYHIYNAELLASALFCRLSYLTGNSHYLNKALPVIKLAASHQNEDGSWYYGDIPASRWIDSFHTGYNLVALKNISKYLETHEFDSVIRKGLHYYKKTFIREDGATRYFPGQDYPIDIHCLAQSIITLEALRDLDNENHFLALSAVNWALYNMYDKRNFFYHQKHRFYMNKISYLRWSQSWMLLALCIMFQKS